MHLLTIPLNHCRPAMRRNQRLTIAWTRRRSYKPCPPSCDSLFCPTWTNPWWPSCRKSSPPKRRVCAATQRRDTDAFCRCCVNYFAWTPTDCLEGSVAWREKRKSIRQRSSWLTRIKTSNIGIDQSLIVSWTSHTFKKSFRLGDSNAVHFAIYMQLWVSSSVVAKPFPALQTILFWSFTFSQERLLTHGLFRQGATRIRHRTPGNPPPNAWASMGEFSRGMRRRHTFTSGGNRLPATLSQLPASRQILDHDALACLMLLLFVEEARLNTNCLHRVFRNLCYHHPTRDWMVSTLMSILQRSGEERASLALETCMEVTPSATPPKLQKQFPKKASGAVGVWSTGDASPVTSAGRNTSWMSIRLEAALGSRASIFQVKYCFGVGSLFRSISSIRLKILLFFLPAS